MHVQIVRDSLLNIPSRANLNASYFQNRQDRYLYFSNQPHLVEYLSAFITAFSKISYILTPSPSLATKPAPHGEGGVYTLTWTNRTLRHSQIESEAQNSIRALQDQFSEPLSHADISPECDTIIYPLIQSGVLGVREEEGIIAAVLDRLLEEGRANKYAIDLTSGYFALYEPYQLRALKDGLDWRILAASPKARKSTTIITFILTGDCCRQMGFMVQEDYQVASQRVIHCSSKGFGHVYSEWGDNQ